MAMRDELRGPYACLFDDLAARGCCLELVIGMDESDLMGQAGKEYRPVRSLRASLRDKPGGPPMGEVPATLATLDDAAVRLRAKLEWAI